jgi:hypothetical protein
MITRLSKSQIEGVMMSHSTKKINPSRNQSERESLETNLLDEFPALPEKFFTFSHEMIALLWMRETPQSPIRGKRSPGNK